MLELITHERRALVARLAALDAPDWDRPSLCSGWTVHQVLAHLCTPFLPVRRELALRLLRDRSIDVAMRQTAVSVADRLGPDALLEVLSSNAASRFHPPGLPLAAPLTDVVAHGCDIFWALGDRTDAGDPERLRPVLDFLVSPRARLGFVPAGRLRGVRLEADDLDWAHGTGEVVRGPALALVMGVLGRGAAASELSGGERLALLA